MTTKVSSLRKLCALALASLLTHFVWAAATPKLLINIGTTTEVDGWVAHDQTGGGNIPDSGTLSQNDITFQVTKASAGGNHSSAESFGSPVETDFETGSYVDIFDQTHETLVDEIIASLGGSVTLTEDVYKTGVINGGQAGHTGTIAGLDSTKKYVVYIGQGYRKSDHGSCHSFRIENSGYTSIEALDYVVTVRGTGTSVATSYTSFNAATTIQPGDNGLMIVRLKGVVPTNSGTISYTMPSGRSGLNFVAVAEVGGADINEWTGAEDTNWSTEGNWTKGVPGADDVVSIPTGATITMTAADQASIMQINGAVTLNGVIDGAKVKATAIAAEATLTVNVAQGLTSSLRNVSGGKIIKTGEGTLRFDNEGGSSINGTTVQIDEGMASVHNSNGDAAMTNPTFIIGENGTLDNKGWFTISGTLTIESDYNKIVFPNTDGSGGIANNAMIGNSPAIVKKGTGTVTLRTGSNGNFGAVTVEGGNLIFGSKQNTTIAGVVSGNGGIGVDGTGLDSVAGTLTLNGNNTYAGGTVITRGQVTLGHDNALGGNNCTVTVNAEGVLNVNGHGNHGATATLNGGTLKNGGSNVGDNLLQFRALTLTADSTVEATGNFGVINGNWGATTITFNGHKLIKTGDQEFWLCNITLPEGDTGTIQINAGDCKVVRNKCNLTGVTFTVPADATDKVVENATVLDAAVGTTYQQAEREGGETIYVVTAAPTFVLGAGNAATVKEGDTVVFDSHYTGNKWSHIPQLSWANGEKVVVDIEMDIGSSVPENSELVVNHKNFSNPSDLKGDYLYGDIGAGATITGTGALFLGYTDNACTIGDGVTISCANVGFQGSGKTATINGTVTITAEVVMSGSKIKLADGAKLITAKLGDDDVITDVAGKKVGTTTDEESGVITYSLVDDTPAFPPYVDTDHQAAYTAWATTGAAVGYDLTTIDLDLAEQAFALNCAPDEDVVAAEMKKFIVVIEFDAEGPQVAIPAKDPNYNIVPVVQGKVNLTDTEWTALEGGAVGDKRFFRATITIPGQND